jgi:riboflavin kinase/FMN adenylyltransferase
MSPDEFVEKVIARCVGPLHVVEGRNFFFGLGRSGNVDTLRRLGKDKGFAVHVVEPVVLEHMGGPHRVSSTMVRQLVREGNVEAAATCLARPFTLSGRVIPGQGHGRLLEFPTANLDPGRQVLPADGVYAGRARVGDEQFVTAISIGNKPTLGPAAESVVEAFLIDADGDYYGREMSLAFAARLRGQERFEDIEALKGQIAKDVARVRDICG